MDGLNSFFPLTDGLNYLFNSSKVAILEFGDNIRFANHQPCKLQSIWKSPSPLYTASMYMKKNSPLTPFISHEIRKLTEQGVVKLMYARYCTNSFGISQGTN